MAKHTPGPWFRPDPPHDTEIYVTETERDSDLEMIAEVGPYDRPEEARANAALIAAAPEREAEHLRDMLHCQERVVNLLEAARQAEKAFRVVTGTDVLAEIAALGALRAAIEREEKEGQS